MKQKINFTFIKNPRMKRARASGIPEEVVKLSFGNGKTLEWEGEKKTMRSNIDYLASGPVYQVLNPPVDADLLNSAMNSGSNFYNIRGNSIKMCYLRIKYTVYIKEPVTAVLADYQGIDWRIVIVYSKDEIITSQQLQYDEWFIDYTSGGAQSSDLFSELKMGTDHSKEVIFDRYHRLPPFWAIPTAEPNTNQVGITDSKAFTDDIWIDLQGREAVYANINPPQTNMQCKTGNLYMWILSNDENLRVNSIWEIRWKSFLYFNN